MKFNSVAERDEYIDRFHPERKCTDIPGVYELPFLANGEQLYLVVNYLQVYQTTEL